MSYKHTFSLTAGNIVKINEIPCEYLGMGVFGTNTYPGKPRSLLSNIKKKSKNMFSWLSHLPLLWRLEKRGCSQAWC